MSILNYLQLQPVEASDDGSSDSPLDDYAHDEEINLDEELDDQELEAAWSKIVSDIEEDPEWFTFSDE